MHSADAPSCYRTDQVPSSLPGRPSQSSPAEVSDYELAPTTVNASPDATARKPSISSYQNDISRDLDSIHLGRAAHEGLPESRDVQAVALRMFEHQPSSSDLESDSFDHIVSPVTQDMDGTFSARSCSVFYFSNIRA